VSFWQSLDAGDKALALQATVGAGMKPAAAARLLQTSSSAVAGHLYARPDGRKPAIRGERGARVLLRIVAIRGMAPLAPSSDSEVSIQPDPAPPPTAPEADAAAAVPPSAAASAAPKPDAKPAPKPVARSGAAATARGWNTGFARAANAVPKAVAKDLAALAAAAIDAGRPVTKCPPAHADGSVLTTYEKIGR
jgi:hypothetical protein